MNITVLGSTGSVGTQSLEVIGGLGGGYNVFALCANENTALLEAQIRKYRPEFCAVYDSGRAEGLKIKIRDTQTKVLSGMDGINFIASHDKTDCVVNSLMGQIGLEPTLAAIKAKKNIALANKEALVAAGDTVMREAKQNNVAVLPMDSEHCAIFQCLAGEQRNGIDKLILTASGGPFYGKTKEELKKVTLGDALCHPTWKMGKKITVDSATMMNKGLELIEACHLFGVRPDDIEIIIHRESIIHSMVSFKDKSVKAQMSVPDMKLCVHYALTYLNGGKREKSACEALDLTKIKTLHFDAPDNETFGFPELARHAIKEGGTLPAVLNAANEAAVGLFLAEKISFLDIFGLVENAVQTYKNIKDPTISDIIQESKEVSEKIWDLF